MDLPQPAGAGETDGAQRGVSSAEGDPQWRGAAGHSLPRSAPPVCQAHDKKYSLQKQRSQATVLDNLGFLLLFDKAWNFMNQEENPARSRNLSQIYH